MHRGRDRGVSPVVGIVLMAGIGILMAGFIGISVVSVGSATLGTTAPSSSIDVEFHENGAGDDYISFVIQAGDSMDVDHVGVLTTKPVDVSGNSGSFAGPWAQSKHEPFSEDANAAGQSDVIATGQQWSAGETVYVGGNGDLEGVTVRLVWSSQPFTDAAMDEAGSSSQVLVKYTAPE